MPAHTHTHINVCAVCNIPTHLFLTAAPYTSGWTEGVVLNFKAVCGSRKRAFFLAYYIEKCFIINPVITQQELGIYQNLILTFCPCLHGNSFYPSTCYCNSLYPKQLSL